MRANIKNPEVIKGLFKLKNKKSYNLTQHIFIIGLFCTIMLIVQPSFKL